MSLVLNFSPIQFDDEEITVGWLPYCDKGDEVLHASTSRLEWQALRESGRSINAAGQYTGESPRPWRMGVD